MMGAMVGLTSLVITVFIVVIFMGSFDRLTANIMKGVLAICLIVTCSVASNNGVAFGLYMAILFIGMAAIVIGMSWRTRVNVRLLHYVNIGVSGAFTFFGLSFFFNSSGYGFWGTLPSIWIAVLIGMLLKRHLDERIVRFFGN